MTDTKHSAAAQEAFEKAYLSANGFHTRKELTLEWRDGLSGVMFRAGIAAAAPAGEPVAYCAPNAKGLPEFGKGWMFSPVPQLMATMPLYAAPVPAAAPKAALTDAQKRAASLFTSWWSMIEAENELTDKPLDGESVALHYMGCGASCMVHVKDLREVCAMLRNISDASGPNAALVTLLKEILDDGQAFMGAIELSGLDGVAWAERARAALAAAGVSYG